jgi:outer membrane protein TolC
LTPTHTRRPVRKPDGFRLLTVLLLLALGAPSSAQDRASPLDRFIPTGPFAGGVPQGTPTSAPLALTVGDAIRRSLEYNLGVLLSQQDIDHARGSRAVALGQLLPNISASVSEVRQIRNLEAFGFPLRGFPPTVGPFNVFDARLFLSQSIFDLHALKDARAEAHSVQAARYSYQDAREAVILATAAAYLQALASAARAESVRAQFETAQALHAQAQDLKQGGLVAGIDVVRADVRVSTERQRTTAAETDLQKAQLQLARMIGLPLGQPFTLSDQIPYVDMPDISLEQALENAYRNRFDYQAAQERVRAAEASRAAALGERLPSVRVNADYGAIGLTAGSARSTFSLTGSVNIPIFEGGRAQGRLAEADADLRNRRSEAEDLRAAIYYEVRNAFLDLRSSEQELQAATRTRDLANQELTQARDRFAAGVANNIEVVQAQEAVALGSEQAITASYLFNLSKAKLAESLGTAEQTVEKYLGGTSR